MLIDEADVYIKRRDDDLDDDIATNAVVGMFQRVLDYFSGFLFLAANRIDDIDEAIVSRCIASVKFNPPDSAARRRIWADVAGQFGLAVSGAVLDALVAKYCRRKRVEWSLDAFSQCSVFRGIDLGDIRAFAAARASTDSFCRKSNMRCKPDSLKPATHRYIGSVPIGMSFAFHTLTSHGSER